MTWSDSVDKHHILSWMSILRDNHHINETILFKKENNYLENKHYE